MTKSQLIAAIMRVMSVAEKKKAPPKKGGKNDLRVQTAYKTAKKAREEKNKVIGGNY